MNLSRLFAPIALVSAIALSGISGSALADTTLRIGVTPVPHADIVNFIKPTLEKEGVKLEVVEFNDYIQPNLALDAGELDANYFQTIPYLEEMVKSRGLNLHILVSVHLEPMALYSKKVRRLADIPAGAKVAVPSDPTNEGRALKVLEHAGLIKLKLEEHDLVSLAEVELGRADEVAYVLDEEHGLVFRHEVLERVAHHRGVEMAALARVDLQGSHARGAYALGVVRGLLVALDHGRAKARGPLERLSEKLGLARTGRRDKIEREHAVFAKELPVDGRNRVVSPEDILLDRDGARGGRRRGVAVSGTVVLVMMVPVGMVMTMLMIVIVGDMSRYIAVLVHMGVHVGVVVFAAAAGCAHFSVSFARIPNWRGAQKLCLCLHSRRLADTPTSTTRTVAIEHWY